jgi:hypothetical protein
VNSILSSASVTAVKSASTTRGIMPEGMKMIGSDEVKKWGEEDEMKRTTCEKKNCEIL